MTLGVWAARRASCGRRRRHCSAAAPDGRGAHAGRRQGDPRARADGHGHRPRRSRRDSADSDRWRHGLRLMPPPRGRRRRGGLPLSKLGPVGCAGGPTLFQSELVMAQDCRDRLLTPLHLACHCLRMCLGSSLSLLRIPCTPAVLPHIAASPESKQVLWLLSSLHVLGCGVVTRHRVGLA